MYTNEPNTYLTGYVGTNGNMLFKPDGYYQLLWVHPPTNITVNVPNSPRFMGYYSSMGADAVQCINAHGELTSGGQNVANSYVNGNTYTWYARYAPTAAIRLDSSGAEKGHHGKEFLFYDVHSHKLYQDYNTVTGVYSNELTTNISDPVILNLPSRPGYYFHGYWSDPSCSGTKYIGGSVIPGVVTETPGRVKQEGLNAVAGYDGSVLHTWYACWYEEPHNLTYYCGPSIQNNNDIAYDSTQSLAQYTGLQPSVVGTIVVGKGPNGEDIICNPPSGDYEFMGWACGSGLGAYYTWSNASMYNNASVDLTTDFRLLPDGYQLDLHYDVKCLAMWKERLNCSPNSPVDYILGQTNSSIPLNEDATNSGSNPNPMNFSYGSVHLEGICAQNIGLPGVSGTPVEYSYDPNNPNPFGHCWCRVDKWTPIGGTEISLDGITPWIYDGTGCTVEEEDYYDSCVSACSKYLSNTEGMRSVFYSSQACGYTIKYNCDNPAVLNPTDMMVLPSVPYLLTSASVCNQKTGYHLNLNGTIGGGWECKSEDSTVSPLVLTSASGIWPTTATSNYVCNARWNPNTIKLAWNSDGGNPSSISMPASCSYGQVNGIIGIPQPSKQGYNFDGWEVTGWSDCGPKNPQNNGTKYSSLCLNPNIVPDEASHGATPETYYLSQAGQWGVSFDYGDVIGMSNCNAQPGETGTVGQLGDLNASGPCCWCQINSFIDTSNNNEQCFINSISDWWVLQSCMEGQSNCVKSCAYSCAKFAMTSKDFRSKLFVLDH
jgi:hypothetical protein